MLQKKAWQVYFKVLNQNAGNPHGQAISWILAKKCTFGRITDFRKNRNIGRDLNPSNPHKYWLFQNSSSPCCRPVCTFLSIENDEMRSFDFLFFCAEKPFWIYNNRTALLFILLLFNKDDLYAGFCLTCRKYRGILPYWWCGNGIFCVRLANPISWTVW